MTDLMPDPVADELQAIRGRPFYLALEPDRVFAFAHLPARPGGSGTGVLLCAAFGWDELGAHRSLRALGGDLARAGHSALRFDFPGSGDSGGSPRDPQRLEAWTAAVDGAAVWLRETQACERVVAIGIGLGGMVACRAVASGALVDDLLLWSVPSRGSLLMREMRTFARIADTQAVDDAQRPGAAQAHSAPDEGDLNVAGFVLSAETIADLEALDLTTLPLPDASRRRILLLGRDTIAPDRRLREHFERSGAAVTIADGPGYGTMMVDPYMAEVPRGLLANMVSWVGEATGPGATSGREISSRPPALASDVVELTVGEATVRETPFDFAYEGQMLSGILTEPVSASEERLTVVLLNAGAVRRIGTHRMWVEFARRWAAVGVPTLRFDVVGVGDSDGDERMHWRRHAFTRAEFSGQVVAAFDELERRGLPAEFVVGGVCSGAYWGLHTTLIDQRVRGLILLNLLAFYWSPELGAARDARRARALLAERNLGTVIRIVATDRWRISRMLLAKLRSVRSLGRGADSQTRFDVDVVKALDLLRERGVQTLMLLSLDEPLYDDFVADKLLERLQEWPNLTLERILTNEHVFRPLWSQHEVHAALDRALARTLDERAARSAPD